MSPVTNVVTYTNLSPQIKEDKYQGFFGCSAAYNALNYRNNNHY